MPAPIIAQLILQFGIPAVRDLLTLLRTKSEPTLDDWIATLDRMDASAKAFLGDEDQLRALNKARWEAQQAAPTPTP